MRPVFIAGVVLAGCAVGSALRPAHSQPPELKPAPGAVSAPASDPHTPYGVGKTRFAPRPATSCAAASCHGGGRVGELRSEHSTWAPEAFPQGASDPHAKAYRVLFNPVSTEMAKKLKDKLKGAEAHNAPLCLKCHAVDSTNDPETREQVLSEGVGCSACHGPAEKWIGEHYTAAWKTLSSREKWEKYEFVPTKNLVARTLNCASCHVGDADRDLNHDLYAAGHPRITFEAARMHHQPDYRKHWTETVPQPDFEVRLWVIGQAATLRAATNLLYERAKRAAENDADTPWPEFAGYSCYACHQRVGEGDVRGGLSDSFKHRRPGVPGWEVWSNTAVGIAAEYCGSAYPGLPSPDLSEVKALRKLMGEKREPAPKAVAAQAAKALKELDAWLAAMQAADDRGARPMPRGTADRLAHALASNALSKDRPVLADHDWDALATNYLGCAAMFHATGGTAGGNTWLKELEAVGGDLKFRLKPGEFGRPDSPADFDRTKLDRVRKQFELLRDATAEKGGK